MATNVLRGKTGEVKTPEEKGLAIGETDAHVFNCPSCARPLSKGTSRCPGCGVRLVMGVMVRRVVAILVLGVALGVPVGVVATVSAVSISLPGLPAAVVVEPSAAAVEPSAAPSTLVPVAVQVPPTALAALSGTAVVNGRISVDATTLSTTLSKKHATTIEIARALRSLAADAALGIDLTGRLVSWSSADVVRSRLDDFYRTMAATARTGLRASLVDAAAYRKAGAAMLTVLADLGEVDALSRALAATADLELPPVAPPGS